MRRWVIAVVMVSLLVAVGYFAYDAFGPKSDRERIEEACGKFVGAHIEADGTVCCDLCAASNSA
jgi:hypothetical protein